nr:ribonuclease H-like domain-containing protein [Tanacetum cinerariifolium]
QMMKGSDIGLEEKQAKLFNEWENFKSTEGELIESYYHCFEELDELRAERLSKTHDPLALMNPVIQNVLIVILRIANQNVNQNRNCNVVETQAKDDINEIKEVNANGILMANLQQASTSGTQIDKAPIYDSDGSAKQCLITTNHDVSVLNYVNDINSCDNNKNANVSNVANQKKLKAKVKKSKKLGSKERLASPRPRKPRTCHKWSPTGRTFVLSGILIQSSDFECQSDIFKSDHACASNHQEPTSKRFLNSTSFLGRLSKFVYVDYMMVVKEIKDGLLKEIERSLDGGLSKTLVVRVKMIGREVYSFEEIGVQEWTFMMRVLTDLRCFEKEKKSWNEMILHHFHQQCHLTDEMRMDDLEWWKRS